MKIDRIRELSIAGFPIHLGFATLKPLTIEDVLLMGRKQLLRHLGIIIIDVQDLDLEDIDRLDGLSKFIILSTLLHLNEDLRSRMEKALKLFIVEDVIITDGIIYINGSSIDEDQWKELKRVLCFQYHIEDTSEEEHYSLANKKAVELQEKLNKNKELVAKLKAKQNIVPEFSDLISAMSAKHPSINLLNVQQLTYYQFIDQVDRLQIVDEYEFGKSSLLAGADIKKLNLKHWTTNNLNKEE